jgi:hypothetical protein
MLTKTSPSPVPHHRIRTTLASLCGALAISLLFTAILLVWLNRTLTDTGTYIRIVGPLADKPDIQNFVADQASEQIIKSAPINDVAQTLLTPEQIAGKTPEQLRPLVKSHVYTSVQQIVRSSQFATAWEQTNRQAHTALVAQLKSDTPTDLTLDLSPIVTSVTDQLKQTQLAPVSEQLKVDPASARVSLKGGILDKAASYYRTFQKALFGLVILVVGLFALTIIISVHHFKTLRRILLLVGISALVLAAILEAPSYIYVGGVGATEQKAIAQIARSLFQDLQLFCAWFGAACIAVAIATKIYTRRHRIPVLKK